MIVIEIKDNKINKKISQLEKLLEEHDKEDYNYAFIEGQIYILKSILNDEF